VRQVVVVAREDVPGERRLVAYVAPHSEVPSDAATLRIHLRGLLPEVMVPSAFVTVEALPLTPNGKLDRAALPAVEHRPGATAARVPPRTPVEEVLAAVWGEVLALDPVGIDDDFFDLGGHSLLATQVVSRIRDRLGVELPVTALFAAPTVRGLAPTVAASRSDGAVPSAPPDPTGREEPLPLSFSQERMWFLQSMAPTSPLYNIPLAYRLRGRLDVTALERALAEVVERHEALRTRFPTRGELPVQEIVASEPMPLEVCDLSGVPPDRRESEARRLAGEEARRPFDLEEGPLQRARLLRLDAEDHVLLWVLHHIVRRPSCSTCGPSPWWRPSSIACTRTTCRGGPPIWPRRRCSTRISPPGSGAGCAAICSRDSWSTGATSWPEPLTTSSCRPTVPARRTRRIGERPWSSGPTRGSPPRSGHSPGRTAAPCS